MYRHPQLDQILTELRDGLEALYGERLAKLVLYGSQARGDAEEYSDMDVLVVLKGEGDRTQERRRTSHLIADLSLKYNTVISRRPVSVDEYDSAENPLLTNIHMEGVAV